MTIIIRHYQRIFVRFQGNAVHRNSKVSVLKTLRFVIIIKLHLNQQHKSGKYKAQTINLILLIFIIGRRSLFIFGVVDIEGTKDAIKRPNISITAHSLFIYLLIIFQIYQCLKICRYLVLLISHLIFFHLKIKSFFNFLSSLNFKKICMLYFKNEEFNKNISENLQIFSFCHRRS